MVLDESEARNQVWWAETALSEPSRGTSQQRRSTLPDPLDGRELALHRLRHVEAELFDVVRSDAISLFYSLFQLANLLHELGIIAVHKRLRLEQQVLRTNEVVGQHQFGCQVVACSGDVGPEVCGFELRYSPLKVPKALPFRHQDPLSALPIVEEVRQIPATNKA
jgi:hypothetical protein